MVIRLGDTAERGKRAILRLEEEIVRPGNAAIHRLVESILGVCPIIAKDCPATHHKDCLRLVECLVHDLVGHGTWIATTKIVDIYEVGQVRGEDILEIGNWC